MLSTSEPGPPAVTTDHLRVQLYCTPKTGQDAIEAAEIRMSMGGRGRALDNVFIERIWRSLKYEDIYLKGYETVPEITDGVNDYFTFYNTSAPTSPGLRHSGRGLPGDLTPTGPTP